VLPAGELGEEGLAAVEAEGRRICLARTADGVSAFDDACPHRGTPLSEGRLRGSVLTCSAHTWEFDVRTGDLLRLRAPACLSMVPARERAGMIEVAL
jgi:nitrite reductase/ring-hydroxylating ferredoxin subunit